MLEWTGERFLPWLDQASIAYEHLHRYAYAATFVCGKRVLDLASGEGYGARMLSRTAASVVGVDVDGETVEHAQSKYGSENLHFVKGAITEVPIENHSFDVIVCFEAIEHIDDHDRLLKEVKRLLKPDGTFIVSTPNKRIYTDEASEENPFHMKELYFEEFQDLIAMYFRNVSFLGQRIHPSSHIWPIGASTLEARELLIERGESEFQFISADKRVPLYFLAVATDSKPIGLVGSVLVDESDQLLQESRRAIEWHEETITSLRTGEEWLKEQVANHRSAIAALEEEIGRREKHVEELTRDQERLQGRLADVNAMVVSEGKELKSRDHQIEVLEGQREDLLTTLASYHPRRFRNWLRKFIGPAKPPQQH